MKSENNSKYGNAIATFTVGFQYLNIVENEFSRTVRSGNSHLLVFDYEVDWEEYDKKTSHSDFKIIIPTLFCLYQAIELILKGILTLEEIGYSMGKDGHKISLLFEKVIQSKTPDKIKEILSFYLKPKAEIVTFLNDNGATVDDISEILRYAFYKKSKKILNYINLKYREKDIIPYLIEIIENSKNLRKEIVSYARISESPAIIIDL